MTSAICILCRKIEPVWINFLNSFKNYTELYIIVDNDMSCYGGSGNISSNGEHNNDSIRETRMGRVKIIYIDAYLCSQKGYCNSSVSANLPRVISWDKALYYFGHVLKGLYNNVWFIEDDVFFMNDKLLQNIDMKYKLSDLICKVQSGEHCHNNNDNSDPSWNHWSGIEYDVLREPRMHALVCASRLSSSLLKCIDDYVNINKQLSFIEALFPTLCLHNQLTISNPDEMRGVFFDKINIHSSDIQNIFYHPIKRIEEHEILREII